MSKYSGNKKSRCFDAGKGYFDNMEVDLVMNLLTVIDNDQQDIALLAVMRSLLFGFDWRNCCKFGNIQNNISFIH